MKSRDIPFVSAVLEAGADDRVFDSLLLTGPLVIGLVVVLGRSLVTEAVAIAYIAAFVGYTLYRGVRT
ncbi:hypothetical protein [Halorubrum trueperi]|uniref:Uncharacterized protein n=1 Tax=Halorubrum trueperi TaxID=2004704 RepID=A0ABD5UHJ9_9EURY